MGFVSGVDDRSIVGRRTRNLLVDVLRSLTNAVVDTVLRLNDLSCTREDLACHQEWNQLLGNLDSPLQNRVLQNSFSPGSVFKVIMALAGLERGVIDADSSVYCNGGVRLYGRRFSCWKAGGHGRVSLREAIRQSCNVYFYSLGQKLGIQEIAEVSRRVGLGAKTGINLLGEVAGLVPSEQWKKQVKGEPWYAGETISVAIGCRRRPNTFGSDYRATSTTRTLRSVQSTLALISTRLCCA